MFIISELTIKLCHLFTEFEVANHLLELWLVDECGEPPVHVDVLASEVGVKHLENTTLL